MRWLSPEENAATAPLYMEVFDQEPQEIEDIYAFLVKKNRILAEEAEGAFVSMLQIVPRPVLWCGRQEILPYIFAVATKSSFRHRGLMKRLMEACLRTLADHGVSMVHLVPAAEHLYEKFGFSYIADTVVFPDEGTRKEEQRVLLGEEDSAALAAACSAWQSRYFSLAAAESAEYYERMNWIYSCYQGGVEGIRQGDVWTGYEIFSMEDGKRHCEKQVRFSKPEAGIPFVMGRILNIPAFLARLKISESLRFETVITLADPVIAENNGRFRFRCAEGSLYWERISPFMTEEDAVFESRMEIGTFTAVLCGYQKHDGIPEEICLHGICLMDEF